MFDRLCIYIQILQIFEVNQMKKFLLITLMSLGIPMTHLFTGAANAMMMTTGCPAEFRSCNTGGEVGGFPDPPPFESPEAYERRLEIRDTVRRNKEKIACQKEPNLAERKKCLANLEDYP
jgi:hypothetical protein